MSEIGQEPNPLVQQHAELLQALTDYSEKLNAISKFHVERKEKLRTALSVFVALVGVAAAALTFAVDRVDRLPTGTIAVLGMFILGVLGAISVAFSTQMQRRELINFQLRPLQVALRRLIVRASQLEEHAATSNDESILFDLRLAEAEAALELSEWVAKAQVSESNLGKRKDDIAGGADHKSQSSFAPDRQRTHSG